MITRKKRREGDLIQGDQSLWSSNKAVNRVETWERRKGTAVMLEEG